MEENEAETSRFAYLLQPIRDLAENWNIDISRELEDYLSELSKISFTLGGVTKLNFAEAALLIQGSAVIYSKKVEYLYSLLYQTLDHLADKRKRKEHNSSLDKDGNDKDASIFDDGPDFLPLDDVLEEADDIDLNDNDDFGVVGGGDAPDVDEAAASDPNKPKRQRNRKEKDPSQEKDSTLNIRYGSQAMAMLTTLNDRGMESMSNNDDPQKALSEGETKRYDFKMNTCQVTKSGALLLSNMMGDEEAIFGSTLSRYNTYGDLIPSSSSDQYTDEIGDQDGAIEPSSNINSDENQLQIGYDDIGGGGVPSDDSDHEYGGGDITMDENTGEIGDDNQTENNNSTGQVDTNKNQREARRQQQLQQQQQQAKQKKQVNLWVLLDPHEETVDKPFQKGKTFKIPQTLKSPDVNNNNKQINTKKSSSKEDTSNQHTEIIIFPHESMALKGSYFKELNYIYTKFIKQSRSLRMRKNQTPNEDIPDEEPIQQQSNDNEYIEAGGYMNDDSDDDDDIGDQMVSMENMEEPIPPDIDRFKRLSEPDEYGGMDLNDTDGNEGYQQLGGYSNYLNYPNPSGKSFEELCQSYVNQYMASAEQYLKETSLMKRINDWNASIVPLLEEQNSHPSFDIVEYSSQIIDNMSTIVKKSSNIVQEEPLADDQIDKELVINFEDLTVGAEPWEVARRFASCLQLANNGNIDMIIDRSKQFDNLSFHLVTTKAKYSDLEKFDEQLESVKHRALQPFDDDDDIPPPSKSAISKKSAKSRNNSKNNNKKENNNKSKSTKSKEANGKSSSSSSSRKASKKKKKDESSESEPSDLSSESEISEESEDDNSDSKPTKKKKTSKNK